MNQRKTYNIRTTNRKSRGTVKKTTETVYNRYIVSRYIGGVIRSIIMRKFISCKQSAKHPYFVGYMIEYHISRYYRHLPLYTSKKVPNIREEFLGELVKDLFKILAVRGNHFTRMSISVLVNENGNLDVKIYDYSVSVNRNMTYTNLLNKILRHYHKAVLSRIVQKQKQFIEYA